MSKHQQKILAGRHNFSIAQCECCDVIHIHTGAVSLRLSEPGARLLTTLLIQAMRTVDEEKAAQRSQSPQLRLIPGKPPCNEGHCV